MTRPKTTMTLVVGALICAGAIALLIDTGPARQPETDEVEAVEAAEPTPMPTATPAVPSVAEAVDLGASDEMVRKLAAELSRHPGLAAYLVSDDLIRRFVGAVNLVAGGYSPRDHLDFLRPSQPFLVDWSGDRLVITPSTFDRYNVVAEVFASLDNEGTAALYRQLAPLFQEAHEEIAWFGPDFDERLAKAIDHLVDTPIPEDDLVVERRTVTFAYADQTIESLTGAQRHLLRTGPRNCRRIQDKLRQLRPVLDLPESTAASSGPALASSEEDSERIGQPLPSPIQFAAFDGLAVAP